MVIGKVFVFREIKEENYIFILLNKDFSKKMKQKYLRYYLSQEISDRVFRIKIWKYLSQFRLYKTDQREQELQLKSQVLSEGEFDERALHVLKMDVKRTNFVRDNKADLENLL